MFYYHLAYLYWWILVVASFLFDHMNFEQNWHFANHDKINSNFMQFLHKCVCMLIVQRIIANGNFVHTHTHNRIVRVIKAFDEFVTTIFISWISTVYAVCHVHCKLIDDTIKMDQNHNTEQIVFYCRIFFMEIITISTVITAINFHYFHVCENWASFDCINRFVISIINLFINVLLI